MKKVILVLVLGFLSFTVKGQEFLKGYEYNLCKFTEEIAQSKTIGDGKTAIEKLGFRAYHQKDVTNNMTGERSNAYLYGEDIGCKLFMDESANLTSISILNVNYTDWHVLMAEIEGEGWKMNDKHTTLSETVFEKNGWHLRVGLDSYGEKIKLFMISKFEYEGEEEVKPVKNGQTNAYKASPAYDMIELLWKQNLDLIKLTLTALDYKVMSDYEILSYGLNPKSSMAGTKKYQEGNVLIFAEASNYEKKIDWIRILCYNGFGKTLVSDFKQAGYTLSSQRNFVENGVSIKEYIYKKAKDGKTCVANIKFLTSKTGNSILLEVSYK